MSDLLHSFGKLATARGVDMHEALTDARQRLAMELPTEPDAAPSPRMAAAHRRDLVLAGARKDLQEAMEQAAQRLEAAAAETRGRAQNMLRRCLI